MSGGAPFVVAGVPHEIAALPATVLSAADAAPLTAAILAHVPPEQQTFPITHYLRNVREYEDGGRRPFRARLVAVAYPKALAALYEVLGVPGPTLWRRRR